MTKDNTSAERQARFRAEKKKKGLKELRGIFVDSSKYNGIKDAIKKQYCE